MPPKRARRPPRERPSPIEREGIPKSVSRVLDAGVIRREYRTKKRRCVGNSDDERNVKFRIGLGETVDEFNRRVERGMAPLIKTALRQSRRVRKPTSGKHPDDEHRPRDEVKEFQASTPRRLSDVAREPPVFEKLPRGAAKNDAAPSGVLSMAQKAMMEEERDKAVRHYRELKARKQRKFGGATLDG